MIEGRYLYYGDDLKDIQQFNILESSNGSKLRLFQNLLKDEINNIDYNDCIYSILYVDGQPRGMGKLLFDGSDFYIDKVIIQSIDEKEIYYDFIIRMLIDKAILLNSTKIQAVSLSVESYIYMNISFKVKATRIDEYGQEWSLYELNPESIQNTGCVSCEN